MSRPPDNQHLAFDELRYRVESAPYSRIAAAMVRAGIGDTDLKILLARGFNVRVEPMSDPTLYFVVTEDQMQQIAQDLRPLQKKKGGIILPGGDVYTPAEKVDPEMEAQVLALKIGSSLSIALSEDYARVLLQARIAEHNAR